MFLDLRPDGRLGWDCYLSDEVNLSGSIYALLGCDQGLLHLFSWYQPQPSESNCFHHYGVKKCNYILQLN